MDGKKQRRVGNSHQLKQKDSRREEKSKNLKELSCQMGFQSACLEAKNEKKLSNRKCKDADDKKRTSISGIR